MDKDVIVALDLLHRKVAEQAKRIELLENDLETRIYELQNQIQDTQHEDSKRLQEQINQIRREANTQHSCPHCQTY